MIDRYGHWSLLLKVGAGVMLEWYPLRLLERHVVCLLFKVHALRVAPREELVRGASTPHPVWSERRGLRSVPRLLLGSAFVAAM